jgi:hypothetical protein
MGKLKGIGWAIHVFGFAIWLFGYLSIGHARALDWDAFTPWWISSFVPDREAELGIALMLASMVPIYWPAGPKRKLGSDPNLASYSARIFRYVTLLAFVAVTLAWWGFLAWLIWRVT